MSDGVSVAERAGRETEAVWDPCAACGANRRLADGLCYACATDPLKVELVELRRENADLRESVDILQEVLDRRLEDDKRTDAVSLVAHLQVKVKDLQRTLTRKEIGGDQLRRNADRLNASNQRARATIKLLRRELRSLRELREADHLLLLSESEHLLLVSILVDVVAEDQTFDTLALHRKVRDLPKNEPIDDV